MCSRNIGAGFSILSAHPKNVYLPEAGVLDGLNDWLTDLFARRNWTETVRRLFDGAGQRDGRSSLRPVKTRLAETETRLRRLQAAIEAGADPAALVDAINRAQEERDVAQAELERTPTERTIDQAEIEARIDQLAETAGGLRKAPPGKLQEFYEAVSLEMLYNAEGRTVDVTIRPAGRDSECVRGTTCALTTRLTL